MKQNQQNTAWFTNHWIWVIKKRLSLDISNASIVPLHLESPGGSTSFTTTFTFARSKQTTNISGYSEYEVIANNTTTGSILYLTCLFRGRFPLFQSLSSPTNTQILGWQPSLILYWPALPTKDPILRMQGMMEYVEKPIHKEVTSATRQPGGVDASSWWLIGFKPCPTGTVHMIPVYCLATSVVAVEVPYGSQVPSNVCLPRVLDHLWVLSHFTNLDSRPVLIGRIAHHDLPGQPATPPTPPSLFFKNDPANSTNLTKKSQKRSKTVEEGRKRSKKVEKDQKGQKRLKTKKRKVEKDQNPKLSVISIFSFPHLLTSFHRHLAALSTLAVEVHQDTVALGTQNAPLVLFLAL